MSNATCDQIESLFLKTGKTPTYWLELMYNGKGVGLPRVKAAQKVKWPSIAFDIARYTIYGAAVNEVGIFKTKKSRNRMAYIPLTVCRTLRTGDFVELEILYDHVPMRWVSLG